MVATEVIVFVVVYLGMIGGGLHRSSRTLDEGPRRRRHRRRPAWPAVRHDLRAQQCGLERPRRDVAPARCGSPIGWAAVALVSTLAGNLVIVGSIANIIVVDAAAERGIRIGWRTHARVGVPVTLATLGVAALFLW
jgi:hypothetical protein